MDKILSLENVEYSSDPYSVLRGLSFSMELGEDIVLFGLENSGIDLLFPIITYVEKDFTGIIRFKGRVINEMSAVELNQMRKDLVYLQSFHGLLGNMTVEDNISLPMSYHSKLDTGQIKNRVDYLIAELKLEKYRKLLPTNIRNSHSLTAAYARAVALNPDLILVEHPLENQSLMNVLPFMESLKKRCLSKDRSVLIITYKPKYFLDYAERFIMLHNGVIVFDGDSDSLKSMENPYIKQFLKNQIEGPMDII